MPRLLRVAGAALGGLGLALLLALLLSVVGAGGAGAAPADPSARELRQPDGTTVAARLYGDEYVNGYETLAGYTLVRATDRSWVFATADTAGRLVPTELRPGPDGRPPADAGIEPHLRDAAELAAADEERGDAGTEGAGGPGTPPAVGTHPVLVVLAQFADQSLSTTPADWAELFFGAGRSVADYYDDVSDGRLQLVAAPESDGTVDDGVVTVTLAGDHPDTGGSFGGFQATARQVLAAIDPAEVDLAALDDDGDGALGPDELHLAIVPAGWEGAQSCPGRSVWAHRSSLGSPVTVDGVVLGDGDVNGGYFTAGELQCPVEGDQQATLGIWVHELGHDLGWIDLYDIDGGSRGVDTWSLMGSHWLGAPIGSRPPRPDPFSRMQVGWLTPTVVTDPGTHVLGSSALGGEVLQVRDNPDGVDVGFLGGGGTGEYFLVEHRTPDGYDDAVVGCGALVWHVDESRFNTDDHARRVDVEEAGDGEDQYGQADAEDPYPSLATGNDAFGPATSPSSDLNTGLPSGVALTDIELAGPDPGCGPTASVTVDPGLADQPPRNDRMADAVVVPLGDPGTATVRGNNVAATHQVGEPRHAGVVGTGSVWWSFRPPRDGYVALTSDSTAREVVAVYTGPRVDRLTRVAATRGWAPDAAAGSPPAPESVRRPLGFPVRARTRYLIAVDSRDADPTGIRLHLDYDHTRAGVTPLFPTVGPGQRPLLAVTVRNTSPWAALRVQGLSAGGPWLTPLDCPAQFTVAPGASRRCVVVPRATGAAGTRLRGTIDTSLRWPALDRYATLRTRWTVPVRG